MKTDNHPFVDEILWALTVKAEKLPDASQKLFIEMLFRFSHGQDAYTGIRYDCGGLDDLYEIYDIYQVVEPELEFPIGNIVAQAGQYVTAFRLGTKGNKFYVIGVVLGGYTLLEKGECEVLNTFVLPFNAFQKVLRGCMLVEKTISYME